MNPARLESLSSYLNLKMGSLKKILTKFINESQLNAKIINDSIYSSTIDSIHPKDLEFFKNIKKSKGKWYSKNCQKEFDRLYLNYEDLSRKYNDVYGFEVLKSVKDLAVFNSFFTKEGKCPFCKSSNVEKIRHNILLNSENY